VTAQYLALSDKFSVEPHAGIRWQASPRSSFAAGYGLYSRMEKADAYFTGCESNRALGFTRSHHLMLSYALRISDDMNLRMEPYYQHLYNVPVVEDGAYSILNREMYYITETLVGKGLGENYGVDVTLERYLSHGLYWMATASLYRSRYRGGDGVWHNTRYNRNFAVNGLIGKEWMVRRRNVLGVNLKASLIGGQRYTPADEATTLARPDKAVQYNESSMYSRKFSPQVMGDMSISYKMNRRRTAHEFALKTVTVTGTIEPRMYATRIINVSYKIEF
jgi:hypothetical protein